MKPTTLLAFLSSVASIAAVPFLSPPSPLYTIAPRELKNWNASAPAVFAGVNTTSLVNASAPANTTLPLNAAKIPVEVVPASSFPSVSRAHAPLPSISIPDLLRNGTGHGNSTEAYSESESDSYTDSDVSESDSDVENDVDEPSNVAGVLPVIFSPFPVASARRPLPSVSVQDRMRNVTRSGNGTDTGSDDFSDSDSYTDSDMSDSDSDDDKDLVDAYLKVVANLNDASFKGATDFSDAYVSDDISESFSPQMGATAFAQRKHRKHKHKHHKDRKHKGIPFKPKPKPEMPVHEIPKELSPDSRCPTKEFLDTMIHSMSEIRRFSQEITDAVMDGRMGYGDQTTKTGHNFPRPIGGTRRRDGGKRRRDGGKRRRDGGKYALACPSFTTLAVVMHDLSEIQKHQHRISNGILVFNANVQPYRHWDDMHHSGHGTPWDDWDSLN
ncbi:hypothetical protein IQ07DRAFT_642539 [Pyrenochaeta sp. DS3sAY3a]|nr:hypothetical protein IQ07DRAFT_642539 [Pyrenochaeta sp. DS3sAY3a]